MYSPLQYAKRSPGRTPAVTVDDRNESLGLSERLHGDGQDVVGGIPVAVLVEVVADPGRVREQVLEGHTAVDQRKVLPEDRADAVPEGHGAVLDETHDDQRCAGLASARDREARGRRVRYRERPMGEPVGSGEDPFIAGVDGDESGECRY